MNDQYQNTPTPQNDQSAKPPSNSMSSVKALVFAVPMLFIGLGVGLALGYGLFNGDDVLQDSTDTAEIQRFQEENNQLQTMLQIQARAE